MNLHALRMFTEVAKTGSVTRSAENLLISQPAVTAQLRNLERELNMKLIQAEGRSIRLTEEGELVAGHAKRLFALERDIEEEINLIRSGMIGNLRIAATELPGVTVLPNWIVDYKNKYPLVDIKLIKGNSNAVVKRLYNSSVHVAIICGEDKMEGVNYYTLFEDELIFVVPKAHRLSNQEISLKEIVKEPFILREENSYTRSKLFTLFRFEGIKSPVTSICIEGMKETIEAVKAGFGVAFVSSLAVKQDLIDGTIGRVFVQDIHVKHAIQLCTRKDDPPFSTAANFITLVKQKTQEKIEL
jgi:DNA-binding transcriptional LysR family regulator